MNFSYALALYSIDSLAPEEMPGVAADALGEGIDSPSLRMLAGLAPFDARTARDLFVNAIGELGETIPPPEHGLRLRFRELADRVRNDSLAPNEAADLAWDAYVRSPIHGMEPMGLTDDPQAVYMLTDLADRWRMRPMDRTQVEAEIREWFDIAAGRPARRPIGRLWKLRRMRERRGSP